MSYKTADVCTDDGESISEISIKSYWTTPCNIPIFIALYFFFWRLSGGLKRIKANYSLPLPVAGTKLLKNTAVMKTAVNSFQELMENWEFEERWPLSTLVKV
jgi:hypothetical protein